MVISNNEIHLWFFNDDDETNSFDLLQCRALLTIEECSKVDRFKFTRNKQQYLMTRAMLRSVLSFYDGNIRPEEWQFNINEHGKPYICNSSLAIPLKFNISHTEKMIVLAIVLDQEIGVDVEYFPRMNDVLEIAKGFFSTLEVEQLFALPPEQQKARFFDLWTLKEAYVKARGTGLSVQFNSFSFSFSNEGIAMIFHQEPEQQHEPWKFWQISPSDQHKIAVVIREQNANNPYSISMRNFISLSNFTEIHHPIAKGNAIED